MCFTAASMRVSSNLLLRQWRVMQITQRGLLNKQIHSFGMYRIISCTGLISFGLSCEFITETNVARAPARI